MLDILSLTHYQLWPLFQRQVDPMKNLFELFVQGHMILSETVRIKISCRKTTHLPWNKIR